MKAVTIIGGGLAGLTLGIKLRAQDVPVKVFEAGTYPRHRVCGEFISGGGVRVLRALGFEPALFKRGARFASTVAFFNEHRQLGAFRLPRPALCVSRYALDALLAERFLDAGGELICGNRVAADCNDEGRVRATGRAVHSTTDGWRWFGLKAHASGVQLCTDLEMHFLRDAYVGLCRLDDEAVNVCGLFRKPERSRASIGAGHAPGDWKAQLVGAAGSPLFRKLAGAAWRDDSFCAVSGLRYTVEPNVGECTIGDAFSLIAPVTGNGMSLAFESAQLAAPLLVAYSRGERSWAQTLRSNGRILNGVFAPRLRWAKIFQDTIFNPVLRQFAVALLLRHSALVSHCYRATR